jgi:hypothetical protein
MVKRTEYISLDGKFQLKKPGEKHRVVVRITLTKKKWEINMYSGLN